MPPFKGFRPTPTTINSSLSYLQNSFAELTNSINNPGNGNIDNTFVAQQRLYGLHIGITALLTTLGIDHTPFLENGLITGIHAMTQLDGHRIHEKDHIETVGRLLQMLNNFVHNDNPHKTPDGAADQRKAEAAPVKNVSISKTHPQNQQTAVTDQQIANTSEITNPVKGTVHNSPPTVAVENDHTLVQTENEARVGDKDSSTDDDIAELPVISGDIHPRAVDEIEPAEDSDPVEYFVIGLTETAPVMIDLDSHELAINSDLAHLAIVDDPLPSITGSDPINPQQVVGNATSHVGEEPNAIEMEVVQEETPVVDDVNMMNDGIGPAEVINEILGDIGEMLDDNNSLRDPEENILFAEECLTPEEDEDSLHSDGKEMDNDSERTVSCCVAGSLVDGQEGVHDPIFTDVREEDKNWVLGAEISFSPKLLTVIDDEKREEGA